MPHKGTTLGSRVAQPQSFTVFAGKAGHVGVRIGARRAFASVREVTITAGYVHVTATVDGLWLTGDGVVRQHGDVIAITA